MFKKYVSVKKLGHSQVSKIIVGGFLALGITSLATANGVGNQEEPVEYLVKFDITGAPSGNPNGSFIINGPGYSTITTSSGEVLDDIVPGLKVAQLTGAEIIFGGMLTDPVVPFTCAPGTCTITIGGSTLTSDAGVPLDGKLVSMWGPVINSDFNPDGSSTPLRILGCGGLKDISGEGKFANMVGSICFNGVFNLPDFDTNFSLTGGSNCTITMHTPVVPIP